MMVLPVTKKQVIASELQAIASQTNELLPEQVIEAARNPNSAMHDWFEWDDTAAASAYRLAQARWLIKSINVVIERSDQSRVIAPAFTFTGTKGYIETQVVVQTEGRLAVAIRALKSCESQLGRCAVPELDDAVDALRRLREQLEAASEAF